MCRASLLGRLEVCHWAHLLLLVFVSARLCPEPLLKPHPLASVSLAVMWRNDVTSQPRGAWKTEECKPVWKTEGVGDYYTISIVKYSFDFLFFLIPKFVQHNLEHYIVLYFLEIIRDAAKS